MMCDVSDTAETYTHISTAPDARTGQAFTFAGREASKMICLIERNLGKEMLREVPPASACKAEEDVREEKRESLSREMPGRKKLAATGSGQSRRSRASFFDFGISKPAQR
jgi:hypothetical protein